MNRILISLATLLTCIGCADSSEAVTSNDEETVTSSQDPTGIPIFPASRMQDLVDSVDHVDYLFYDLDFSMSMDQQPGINYAIATIGDTPAKLDANCKPIGRIFYEVQGRTAASAQLYFSPGCAYLSFVNDAGDILYASEVSPVGKDFLNQQFGQIIPNYVPVN